MRENLKKARKEKGLTQKNVADQLGMGLVYYQKIEQGSWRGDLGYGTVWKICLVFINAYYTRLHKFIPAKWIV